MEPKPFSSAIINHEGLIRFKTNFLIPMDELRTLFALATCLLLSGPARAEKAPATWCKPYRAVPVRSGDGRWAITIKFAVA